MDSTILAKAHFILYVEDQARSTEFYTKVLDQFPSLNTPGMTEFVLVENGVLGLMPISGIKRLLGENLPDPVRARGIPRSEIYLYVKCPLEYHQRALAAGALELSGLENRNWGDRVSYCLDLDGHVLAFAEKTN